MKKLIVVSQCFRYLKCSLRLSFIIALFLTTSLFASTSKSSVSISYTKKGTLKNPELIHKYLKDTGLFYSFGEHIILNSFMGLIVGGFQGALIGLYDFELAPASKDDQFSTMILVAGIMGGVGLLSGVGISFVEYYFDEQFTIGPIIMEYTMYGTFIGAFVGSAVGGGVYGSSGDLDDLINIAGFGAMGGFIAGSIAYVLFDVFSLSLSDTLKMDAGYDPWKSQYFLKISRPLSSDFR